MFPENCLTRANLGPCKLTWLQNGGFGQSSQDTQACLPPCASVSLTPGLHPRGLASYPGASALAVLTLGCSPPHHSSLPKMPPPHNARSLLSVIAFLFVSFFGLNPTLKASYLSTRIRSHFHCTSSTGQWQEHRRYSINVGYLSNTGQRGSKCIF